MREDHEEYLAGLAGLLKRAPGARLVVVGDFNQRIGQRSSTPLRLRAALQSTLGPNLPTATISLGFQGRRTIDHIALSEDLVAKSLGVIGNVHQDGNLSDHFAVAAGLRRSLWSWPTWTEDCVAGLTATRYVGEPGPESAHLGINRWVALFAGACPRAVSDARQFEERVRRLQAGWRERADNPRRDSAMHQLIGALPSAPVLTVTTAAELTGPSFQAANQAIDHLAAAGVLVPVNVGRRNRAFEAPEGFLALRLGFPGVEF